MHFEPKDLFEKLEFNKILTILEKECLGELGRAAVRALRPVNELEGVERRLRETTEYMLTLSKSDPFPIAAYFPLDEDLKLLEVPDYVLTEDAFKRINIVLLFVRDIFRFFNATRREVYPALYDIIRPITFDDGLIAAIEGVIDEEGEIRADASPELQRIRKAIISRQRELDRVFRNLINEYRPRGWLSDNVESLRNGRRVLSVPSEHKRKIRGIIHDESTTGKTAFIEPEAIIDINNDIFDLETEEKREIYRILKELSATLRPYAATIRGYQDLLVRFDVVRTKAVLANRLDGVMPKLKDKPHFGIINGYHPLLLLKNKEAGKKTVPFTLDLHKGNRMLLLSGPNAGGKSITMKAVGLLQLMLQTGIPIPVEDRSEMGLFDRIFADIGDQQSIEDDLSTYSSRLENMRVFLEKADRNTLLLIDEFGSGTDPKIGGAIAESILRDLNNRKLYGVVTTHYSNLKVFAFKTKGIVNGAMHFDKESLSPTYELKVGRPGSSYAFEIAHKSGLPEAVIAYARRRTGESTQAVDQLLVDLQQEKQEVEEKLAILREREQKLEKLIRNYEQLYQDLEVRRKKMKLEAKEQALQQTAQDNKAFEQVIREIKEKQNLEKAKQLAAKVKDERKELATEVSNLREQIYYQPPKRQQEKQEIEVGDHVRMRTGGAVGTVEAIEKNKAVVQMGQMRMTIKLRDLQPANAPLEMQSNRSVQTDTVDQNSDFESRIDIRGMRMEEAMQVIENFVDQALISSVAHLKIIHGKGNGTLRQVVRKKLREYDVNMEISHPEAAQGGDGVTLVEIL